MRLFVPITGGLVAGILVATLIIGAIVAWVPDEVGTSDPPSAAPSPSASSPATPVPSPTAEAPGGSARPTSGAIVTAFHIGQPAPPLQVPQVGGGAIDLTSLKGKPVWVSFMATWCPQCRDDFPQMNSFAARYADAGLVVVAVDVREDEGAVAAFASELGAIFPIGLDSDGTAQDAWEAYALPVHFWIDAEGIVRDGGFGGLPRDLMARGVQRILPDVEVTP